MINEHEAIADKAINALNESNLIIKRLKAEIEKLVRSIADHVAVRKTYYDENTRLRAERDELLTALMAVQETLELVDNYYTPHDCIDVAENMLYAAKEKCEKRKGGI